jgi:hypothetical protein
VTDDYEPRQVREEAAVNNSLCITKQSGLLTCSFREISSFAVRRRMHDQGPYPFIPPYASPGIMARSRGISALATRYTAGGTKGITPGYRGIAYPHEKAAVRYGQYAMVSTKIAALIPTNPFALNPLFDRPSQSNNNRHLIRPLLR